MKVRISSPDEHVHLQLKAGESLEIFRVAKSAVAIEFHFGFRNPPDSRQQSVALLCAMPIRLVSLEGHSIARQQPGFPCSGPDIGKGLC
jgi:hypothetical protein